MPFGQDLAEGFGKRLKRGPGANVGDLHQFIALAGKVPGCAVGATRQKLADFRRHRLGFEQERHDGRPRLGGDAADLVESVDPAVALGLRTE